MGKVNESFKKSYRAFLLVMIVAGVIGCVAYYVHSVKKMIPDTLNLNKYSVEKVNFNLPFIGTIESKELDDDIVKAAVTATGSSGVDLLKTLNIRTGDVGSYQLEFKLMGMLTLKKVQVNVCQENMVIPCGIPVGIYMRTEGIMVVDIGDVATDSGLKSPAKDIVWPGDYIYAINNVPVNTKEELIDAINEAGKEGEFIIIDLRRNEEKIRVRIKPVVDEDGKYKIGAWVRDDCQGLGTLTYVDSKGGFGALGHGISDIDTGKLVNIKDGKLYCARIWSIIKGKTGTPGEVVGTINYNMANYLGSIYENSQRGVYGTCNENIYRFIDSYALPVGYKHSIKKGTAYVRSFIDGKLKDYEINITNIDLSDEAGNKGISFTVTDEALLELTGGIIQGMSGSPILQDDKVIGAVTHVLVNDSSKGYGIFVEDMLE